MIVYILEAYLGEIRMDLFLLPRSAGSGEKQLGLRVRVRVCVCVFINTELCSFIYKAAVCRGWGCFGELRALGVC